MKTIAIRLLTLFAAVLIINLPANSQTQPQTSQNTRPSLDDSLFFKALVTNYVQSIEKADTTLGSEIWSPTAEISFINPMGTEYGWDGIKKIYFMFRDNFTSRKLTFSNLKYAYYGNVSWVTFYWIFDGTLKADNSAVQTKGRETQIWKKVNNEWRLVHVHYSAMPLNGEGQGF
jgi:ketosteroid isomerase-like protein